MDINDLLEKINNTNMDLGQNIGIIKSFKKTVNSFPQRICIRYKDIFYTYKKFDEITDKLALYLKAKGVKKGDIVAIYQNRSENFLISIFAILKLNATYLPLEKIYPKGRINNILQMCKAKFLVSDENVAFDFDGSVIFLPKICDLTSEKNFEFEEILLYNSAYILFTSGSTGTPKGIEIMQSGIVNLSISLFKTIFNSQSKCKNIGLISPFVFDASVGQIYTALLSGYTLDIVPDDVKMSYEKLDEFFFSRKIDSVEITPTRLSAQIQYYEKKQIINYFPPVIISAGEALDNSLAKRFFSFDKLKTVKIFDYYGPTECTVYCTYKEINYNNIKLLETIPIGKPINNTKVYVLDDKLQLCPVGVKGELYVSGIGLSKGYITNESNIIINEKAFIANPFEDGKKLYKTGDIVSFTIDGDLLYYGRKDDQIKLHGFRIELSEIEKLFQKFDGITQSKALVINDNNEEKIVLYYISSQPIKIDLVRNYLKDNLPYYMLPSYIVPVQSFKCNINGKLDKSALNDYHDFSLYNQNCILYKQEDTFANKFFDICKSCLEKDEIELGDNFVYCGGTSLDILKINTHIYDNFGIILEVSDFFECDNFYEMAQRCKSKINSEINLTENSQTFKVTQVKISKFQHTLFECEKISAKNRELGYEYVDNINIISLVESNIVYDIDRLKYALDMVVNRHDILRATFEKIDSEIKMILNEKCNEYFNVVYANENICDINYNNYFSLFDIKKSPLFKITLFIDKQNHQSILIDIHHAIFDHISTSIFLNDLFAYYFDKPLPKIKISTFNYLNKIHNFSFESEKKFWHNYLLNRQLAVPLSYDKETEFKKFCIGNHTTYEKVTIDQSLTKMIRKVCAQIGITEYLFLLNTLGLYLGHIENKNDLFISILVSGRNNTSLKAIPYIYLFTKMVPVRFKFNLNTKLSTFLLSQNCQLNEVLQNSVLDIEDIYRTMSFKDLVSGRLCAMLFNYVEEYELNSPDIKLKTTDMAGNPDILPIYIVAIPKDNCINLKIKYMENLYTKEKIQSFAKKYIKAINSAVNCLLNQKNISDLFDNIGSDLVQ